MNKVKKDAKKSLLKNKPQSGREVKKGLPVKTPMTDDIKNTASQAPGLNQAKIIRDDLFPSDGDNLTN
jgi:hypothetical protein